jgi:hypothetical protein
MEDDSSDSFPLFRGIRSNVNHLFRGRRSKMNHFLRGHKNDVNHLIRGRRDNDHLLRGRREEATNPIMEANDLAHNENEPFFD